MQFFIDLFIDLFCPKNHWDIEELGVVLNRSSKNNISKHLIYSSLHTYLIT